MESIVYKLVYIDNHNYGYKNYIYLLNDNGKITKKVFVDFYLAKDKGNRNELIVALHSRVYVICDVCKQLC